MVEQRAGCARYDGWLRTEEGVAGRRRVPPAGCEARGAGGRKYDIRGTIGRRRGKGTNHPANTGGSQPLPTLHLDHRKLIRINANTSDLPF